MSSFWSRNTISKFRDNFSKSLTDILERLELMDRKWSINPPDENHSYGRLPGETELRLWNIPESTGAFLYWFCKTNKLKKIIEIGTSAGYSTLWLAQALNEIDEGKIDTWEILHEKAELAQKHCNEAGLSDFVNIWNEDASNIENRISVPKSIDLIFIDGDKENYDLYYEISANLLRRGGFVIVDNAVDSGGLMINFINKITSTIHWDTYIFDIDNGILVAQKK